MSTITDIRNRAITFTISGTERSRLISLNKWSAYLSDFDHKRANGWTVTINII